jgi:hypothetical protein
MGTSVTYVLANAQRSGWIVMFKKIAVTISAVALVMLAIALAPAVPTALATARATITNDDANLNEPVAEHCAAFEAWFLDPACTQVHAKKAMRTKHHLAHKGAADVQPTVSHRLFRRKAGQRESLF